MTIMYLISFQAYYPGLPISGSIQLVVTEPKWYQYVGVAFEGKGRVHWTETHTTGTGDNRRTHTTHYSDNETFADLLVIVWGNKEAPQPTRLDPGTFNFPFQFTIPSNCPPTFSTHTGQINYKLYGVVSSQVNEYKIETPLTVNCFTDLNQQPHLLQPVEQSTVKTITVCCCCKSGEAEITFKMPRTGFCIVQERIPVTFECRNGSSRQISVRVEVAQNIVYNARGHTRPGGETIGNYACQIPASENDTKSVEFDLPASIQLAFTSRIINVAHSVKLWVTHSLDFGFLAAPPIAVPVTIGNVPFRGPPTTAFPETAPVSAGNPPPQGGPPPSTEPGYPPPSTEPGYPPQGPPTVPPSGPVTHPETVPTAPPNAELQSQAPPPYGLVVS